MLELDLTVIPGTMPELIQNLEGLIRDTFCDDGPHSGKVLLLTPTTLVVEFDCGHAGMVAIDGGYVNGRMFKSPPCTCLTCCTREVLAMNDDLEGYGVIRNSRKPGRPEDN